MYATIPLATVLGEVRKIGATSIDIWSRVHSDHRDQVRSMGLEAFGALLREHEVELGVFTCYPLGPFRLQGEMAAVRQLGGEAVLCGTTGPREPAGQAAKVAVRAFLERMQPHIAKAEELGVTILLENHANQLLHTPDSLRYFADMNRSPHLKLAYAIHHMQAADPTQIAPLIAELGNDAIGFIYFQEHGKGAHKKMPKHEEMQQMPGFGGGLDYRPIVAACRQVEFSGPVEIFMHPVPRGIPILPTASEITAAINKSRRYVEACLEESA